MEKSNCPIGVFDSGLGGISVLQACARLLPCEDFLYYGDSANAPYGEKPVEEVRRLSADCARRLLDAGCKAIVVACNTATSAAITDLRLAHPGVPIIGIEPAVKPAAQADDSSTVLVLATPLTIHEQKYQNLAAAFCHEANVISLPCAGLAEMIDSGVLEGPELERYLQELFFPFRHCSVDYMVLGCTHYPFILPAIRRCFERPVAVIDGSSGTARQLRRRLEETRLLTRRTTPGEVRFENSDPARLEDCERFYRLEYRQ